MTVSLSYWPYHSTAIPAITVAIVTWKSWVVGQGSHVTATCNFLPASHKQSQCRSWLEGANPGQLASRPKGRWVLQGEVGECWGTMQLCADWGGSVASMLWGMRALEFSLCKREKQWEQLATFHAQFPLTSLIGSWQKGYKLQLCDHGMLQTLPWASCWAPRSWSHDCGSDAMAGTSKASHSALSQLWMFVELVKINQIYFERFRYRIMCGNMKKRLEGNLIHRLKSICCSI